MEATVSLGATAFSGHLAIWVNIPVHLVAEPVPSGFLETPSPCDQVPREELTHTEQLPHAPNHSMHIACVTFFNSDKLKALSLSPFYKRGKGDRAQLPKDPKNGAGLEPGNPTPEHSE